MSYKIGLVSLGCSKNLVDSERMLYVLDQAGYTLTDNLDSADAVVVNTCGFIDEARQEAVDNILELAELKREGRIRAIVVTGCLAQRHKEEILREIPEIDALIGCGSYGRIVQAMDDVFRGQRPVLFDDVNQPMTESGRIPSMPPHSVYIKIAEGCDNLCAYCVIPSLRGTFRSRRIEDIVSEVRQMAGEGAREINIIAQDVTRYGEDLYGKRRLPELLRAVCAVDGIEWVRLHYLYPSDITDELIETVKCEPKIVKYLDIPIQHIDDGILKAMGRRYTGRLIRELFSRLRREIDGVVLRTTVMVGFPGEGEEEFEALCEFLREARIERGGVFAFSPQEETAAADLANQVEVELKNRRAEIVTDIQNAIMDDYAESLCGKTITVLCEGYDRLAETWVGRSAADSPEIDGRVFFSSNTKHKPGDMVRVRIEESLNGDPVGSAC